MFCFEFRLSIEKRKKKFKMVSECQIITKSVILLAELIMGVLLWYAVIAWTDREPQPNFFMPTFYTGKEGIRVSWS